MTMPDLTEGMARQGADAESFNRVKHYVAVSLVRRGDTLQGEVEGSEPMPYRSA